MWSIAKGTYHSHAFHSCSSGLQCILLERKLFIIQIRPTFRFVESNEKYWRTNFRASRDSTLNISESTGCRYSKKQGINRNSLPCESPYTKPLLQWALLCPSVPRRPARGWPPKNTAFGRARKYVSYHLTAFPCSGYTLQRHHVRGDIFWSIASGRWGRYFKRKRIHSGTVSFQAKWGGMEPSKIRTFGARRLLIGERRARISRVCIGEDCYGLERDGKIRGERV